MSQNTLIEKIKNDATKTVADIKAKGTTEVESIQREIETAVAELTKSRTVALEKKKAHLELVAVSKAKQAGNIAVQSAKRAQIDAIFNEIAKDLQEQSSAEYVALFSRYVADIVPKDAVVEKVHAPVTREEETKQILKATGFTGDMETSQAIKAGLVLYTKDGVYDVTLARLMNEQRSELEMVVINQVMA